MKKIILDGRDGTNIIDWLYLEDHISAVDLIFHESKIGETYNIGGNNEMMNK
jgi:dTDP-glucose 4,6-dehydratase